MKRTIFALVVSAMVLVSCHQPTKEEQLKEQVMVVFNDYANENFKGEWSMDSVVFDTAGTSYRYAVSMRDLLETLADFGDNLVTQALLDGDVLTDIKRGQNITNEMDTSLIVVAVVYTTRYGASNKGKQTAYYCGIRHSTIHAPRLSGTDALKDIHKPSEQAIYNACEDVAIKTHDLNTFLKGRSSFITSDDVYNLWVNRTYRIDPQKLD